ncbi:hypothetical protein L873DRAFT_1789572 [Choiromyces venosus 120613-1]|uniref:Uncharacterized protein n=1 Tax=Choiromyces venosus 120613-1 TaxID=1336337 RepID=A0A3N4JN29_9PEZI|nr:hypothetical protein L873DRAFT_1789572 [Choiromyces venosus 120613-1]
MNTNTPITNVAMGNPEPSASSTTCSSTSTYSSTTTSSSSSSSSPSSKVPGKRAPLAGGKEKTREDRRGQIPDPETQSSSGYQKANAEKGEIAEKPPPKVDQQEITLRNKVIKAYNDLGVRPPEWFLKPSGPRSGKQRWENEEFGWDSVFLKNR